MFVYSSDFSVPYFKYILFKTDKKYEMIKTTNKTIINGLNDEHDMLRSKKGQIRLTDIESLW